MYKYNATLIAALALGSSALLADGVADAKLNSQNTLVYGSKKTEENLADNGPTTADFYDSVQGKVITPCAGPVVTGGVDFFISADFIYWYSSVGNESNAVRIQDATAVQTTGLTTSSGNSKGISSMDPGFKVAIGLDLKNDGWDTSFEYTWLRPKESYQNGNATTNADLFNIGNALVSGLNGFYTDATTCTNFNRDWNLNFNVIDWEMGRSYFISPKLILRPHIGLKGAWQTQRFRYYFNNLVATDTSSGSVDMTGSYKMSQKQSYWGVGFRGGLDTSWQFDKSWSLFGNVNLSPLYGRFKTTRTDTALTTGTPIDFGQTVDGVLQPVVVASVRDSVHMVNMVFETEIGFRYDYYWDNNDYRFRLEAAWEEQYWMDFYHLVNFNGVTSYKPNIFQGLTFKVRFDF